MPSDQDNASGNEESETVEIDGSNISDFLKKSDILAALQQQTMAVSFCSFLPNMVRIDNAKCMIIRFRTYQLQLRNVLTL